MRTMSKIAATAGAVGALATLPMAVAQAAPNDRVPGTDCTVAQVERATVAVAPETAQLVHRLPGGRAEAQRILTLPPAQREARLQQLGRENPELASYYFANQAKINGTIGTIAATCARY